MSLFQLALEKYKKDVMFSLFREGIPYIINKIGIGVFKSLRKLTPIERYSVWNGVKVSPEVAPKYRLIDKYLPLIQTDYNKSEGGEVEFHKELTKPGDTVVIIGGGRGVTTVHAAQKSKPDGKVIVFEASEKYSKIIQEVVNMNNVNEFCEIRQALVGPEIKVYGDLNQNQRTKIHPKELPPCDVLEMDCEGAELEIIKNLQISPGIIIMEVHPQRYQYAPEAIDELTNIGYEIIGYRSNEGEKLSKVQFNKELQQCSRGEAPAPVIAAKHSC